MMKKFSIILLLAMTLQLVNVQPVMGMADVGITEEKNIQISIGNGEKQVGYLECHDGNRGPEDFDIYGYQMYVLDSVNKKVLVYNNNEWSYNIYVEECRYPGLLCVDEDKVYVLDMNQDMIIQYDKYGNVQRNLIIPVNEYALYNAYFIKDMYIQNNKLCLEDIFGNIYVLEEDVFVSNLNSANILSSRNDEITVKGQECNISQFSKNTSLITIDKMNEEVLAIVNELYDENNVLRCNTNICLYDESGALSKYHSIDLSDWYATPQNYIEIENDTAYIMECQMNNIVIRKMDFTNVSSSDDKPYGKLVETRTENNGIQVASQNAITSFSREEVIERASEMAQVTWTVQDGHKVVRNAYSDIIIVPNYVKNTQSGKTLVGIPYCWGGYFGYDSLGNGKFLDYINQNSSDGALYTAGNINTDRDFNYQSHTIGLDCSGYLSSAYGLEDKYNTRMFASNCTPINREDMQMGDVFCYSGHHVVMFYYYSNGYYLCFDCAVTPERTIYRPWSATDLANYSCYTPW